MSSNINSFLKIVKKSEQLNDLSQVKVIDEGWDRVVIISGNTAYSFAREKEYQKKFPVIAAFSRELAKIVPVKIPVLQIQKNSGLVFATYDYIHGTGLTVEVFEDFSKERKLALSKKLGAFLSALHSFSVKEAKDLGLKQKDPVKAWKNALTQLKSTVFKYIGKEEQKWITKYYESFSLFLKKNPYHPRVAHMDLLPEHIIVDPKYQTLSGIIDFADCEIADPAMDFALLVDYGEDFLRNVLENYELPVDENFITRMKFYKDRLVISYLKHAIEIKDREGAKEFKEALTQFISENPNPQF